MRSADVANEFNRVLGTKIAGANEEKMSELVKGVREEVSFPLGFCYLKCEGDHRSQ